MKAATNTINRKRRTGPKARSASQITEPGVAREYQAIFTNNGKPMVIVEADTTIFMANAEFERLSGYTKKEIEGKKKWTEFVARGDRKRMREYHLLRKSDPMLTPRCCEFRFLDRNGKVTNVVLTIGQIPGTNRSMASLQDVTDRRRAEATQRVGAERYKTLFENSRDAIYITAPNGAYIDANPAALALFGYTKEAMKKVKAQQLYADPADARRLRREIEEKGFAQDFEARLRKKDGKEMDCLLAVTAQHANDGSIVEYQYIVRDITERKKEEEALRESEEKYRTILETMHDAYFEIDLAGTFTFVNDAACRHLGYTKKELIGMNNRAYTSPETAEKIYKIFKAVYKERKSTKVFDYEAIRKDGATITLELSVSLVRDAKGKPIGFRGVSRDITERKQMEEVLRQSEERYRTILETMYDGYFEVDLAGNFTYVNDAQCRMVGSPKERLIGRSNRQYTTKEEAKKLYEIFNGVYRTGEPVKACAFEYTKRDGTRAFNEISVFLIRDAQGTPIGFRGVSRDVTERKRAEETLRQNEEKYRSILENITEGYYENDPQGNFTFFNDSLPNVYGYTKDELLHMNYRQYMDEENAQKVYEAYNKVYTTGEPNTGTQFKIIRKDGTRKWLENSVSLIRDKNGRPTGFRGISRDITEHKDAEEALRQSEERYRSILETMQEAYYEIDLAGRFTYVNNTLCKHLGYSKEELIGKKTQQYQNETEAKKSHKAFKAIYETGEPLQAFEVEYISKDGTKRIYELSASLIRDTQGKPIGFRGVSRDVTERKQMEEALQLRLKQLGALTRASQVVTATLAIDDVLQEVVSLANNAVGSDYTGVVLIDESGHLIRSADNVPGIPSLERRIREKGFTHWITHSHKALIIDEIGEDGAVVSPADLDEGVPRFADIKLVEAGVKSLAGLPLLAKDRLLGVLYLHGVRPHVFKSQLGLLTAFANQAAIAIENARLFEEAQHELAERKRAEEHLQRYAAELERSNEEVKNFAYIVSHDLRVPLVNLKGYTSELQSALKVIGGHFDAALPHLNDEARSDMAIALHEDVPEALEFITNSVSRMDGFINAVLILSRLGRRELKPEAIDMNALVQTVLEPLSYQIQEQEIAVTVDSLPEVVADRTSMEQIVGNILGNAVKYLDPDRPGEIEINAERNHQETIFRIRDTGRGIAQEDMHKVFAPFRRAGKQDAPGEGMGLAYVQTLVRRHGGRIWCESEPGKGTTFTFTIANPSGKGAHDA